MSETPSTPGPDGAARPTQPLASPPNSPPSSSTPPGGSPYGGAAPNSGTTTDVKQTIAPFWRWLRGLGIPRSSDRWIGGVAGGVADRYGLDPLLVRGLFIVAAMLGGAGFVLYGLAWLLLPEPDGRIHAEELVHGRFDQAVVGAALFLLVGLDPFDAGRAGSWVWGVGKGLGWLALIALGIWLWSQHRPTTPNAPGAPATSGNGQSPSGTGPTEPWGTPAAGSAPTQSASATGTSSGSSASSASSPTVSMPTASFASAAPATAPMPGVYDAGYEPVAPVTAAPTKPPSPPKPPKPSSAPNRGYVAAVVGVAGLAVAALLIADRVGTLEVSTLLILATAVGVLGVGIVLAGLAGRRGGLLSFLAIVGLVLVPGAANRELGWNVDLSGVTVAGSADWTPTTTAEAEEGLRLVAGSAVIDLTDVPLPSAGAEPVTVPVRVTAGDADIILPEGVPILLDVEVFAGSASWDVDGVTGENNNGVRTHQTVRLGPDQEPRLVLELVVGAGDATIQGAAS